MSLRYLSVCSGIEAASVAWHPFGWQPAAFSEIEPFPRAVLSHRWPGVPLHGDFTTIRGDEYGPIHLLVGGTPCQSFSVAGLRGGLADERGNLALEFLRLAQRTRSRWLVWENVPGVLSSDGGRDFGAILGGMVELGYGFAYRVLDAQYVRVDGFKRAVPQRRRRVFVVGHLGDWRRPAAVLFEREGLSGHPAPRREAGERVAATLTRGAESSGEGGYAGRRQEDNTNIVAGTLLRNGKAAGSATSQDAESGLLVAHSLRAQSQSSHRADTETFVAHSLRAGGFDASEDGTGRGTPLVPISFSFKDHGGDAGEIAPTMRSLGAQGANGGSHLGVAFDMRGREGGAQFEGPHETANIRAASGGSSWSYVAQTWAVRRLTPLECERLQGFPDGYTDVPLRGKPASDGPRYKALGNSMACNVMRWVGKRIQQVDALPSVALNRSAA